MTADRWHLGTGTTSKQTCDGPSTRRGRCVRVLLLSPDPALGGGVVEFNALLQRTIDPCFSLETFVTGRRPGWLGRVFRGLAPLLDAVRLAARLAGARFDVLHLNPSFVPRAVLRDGLFLLVARLFFRGSVVVFFRGWESQFFDKVAGSRLWRWLFRACFDRVDGFIVLGSSFKADLHSIGYPQHQILVLTTMFDGRLIGSARRARFDTTIQVLFLARFDIGKGIHELLSAFHTVSRRYPNVRLVMAGSGPLLGEVLDWRRTKGLVERVDLPGYVREGLKAQLLADSDIFVLPSYREGCPNSLIEALASGLSSIVTAVGGIPDVVKDELSCLFVSAGNASELERALERLIRDESLRRRLGECGRSAVWQKCEAAAVTAKIAGLYVDLVMSRCRG